MFYRVPCLLFSPLYMRFIVNGHIIFDECFYDIVKLGKSPQYAAIIGQVYVIEIFGATQTMLNFIRIQFTMRKQFTFTLIDIY